MQNHCVRTLGAMALTLVLAAGAAAQDGEVLYASCAACHGADASGNPSLGAPALAGQLEGYLARQLQLFRRDVRGVADDDSYGAQMQPFARQLADDAAVAAVASYLAALAPPVGGSVGSGDPRRGASLYNGNCGACHGGRGEGNASLMAPRLAGLDRQYLERQLRYFREGLRGAAADDRLGRQMAMMANTLSDQASLNDVLTYLETLAATGAED